MFHLGIHLKMSCLITRAGLPSLLVLYAAKNILHLRLLCNGIRVDQADVWDKLFLKLRCRHGILTRMETVHCTCM